MNYQEAMAYVNGLSRFGINLGLRRITALLEAMGNPQQALRFIHIAGTNGKGSVSTMLSNILTHSGCKTGLFISPYVLCFRERMQVNGEMISEEDFADCADFVCHCTDKLAAEMEFPTQFELETAIAFEWYKRCQCDIVCLEVGLGGRFDSTNVIAPPLLQIITAIGLDHTAILGENIKKIAFEKAGIIKGGATVLYPLQEKDAFRVIEAQCKEMGSTLIRPDLSLLSVIRDHWLEGEFSYDGASYQKSLPGKIQIYNCITVIAGARELQSLGLPITEADIRHGIEHTSFPARMELLSREPLVLLDGAHNTDGARALAQTLDELSARPITLMMGVLEDKNYEEILKILGKYASHFIAVTPDNPRALSAKTLAAYAHQYCSRMESYEDWCGAVRAALQSLAGEAALVVCGSLYLASSLRPILLQALSEIHQSTAIDNATTDERGD